MSDIQRPLWIRVWLYGTRKRKAVVSSIWFSGIAALVFLAACYYGPWLYLRATMPETTNPAMYLGLGMALMPDFRMMGNLAAVTMLLVAFVYWRALKWMDKNGVWAE